MPKEPFQAKELMFTVGQNKFVVDVVMCGQKTVQRVELPLDTEGLEQLKKDLRATLSELETLDKGGAPSKAKSSKARK